MNALEMLAQFIASERWRFSIRDNTLFGTSFSKLTRYYQFLQIIVSRYREVSKGFVVNTDKLHATVQQGTHERTEEQLRLLNEGAHLAATLHLEIESFYLFAKILLDRTARSLEFYFGPVRKRPLDSHDDLVKYIVAYSQEKNLNLPRKLLAAAQELKRDISDHRDYQIAHEKSPRTLHGTAWDAAGQTKIISSRLYPKEGDQQVQTKLLDELLQGVDVYLEQIVRFIKNNADRTTLEIEKRPSTTPASIPSSAA